MLELLNHILTTAPSWTHIGEEVGMVGVPINAILDWPMGTRSGFAVFLDPTVNAMLKRCSTRGESTCRRRNPLPYSTQTSPVGSARMGGRTLQRWPTSVRRRYHLKTCSSAIPRRNTMATSHGTTSSPVTSGRRHDLVAFPDDDNVIVNPCESRTYKVATDIKYRDRFWVKGQPYSVVDILSQDPLAEQFVGGTIYQAFLSALSYHRWHSPVSGTIRKSYVVDGTYYSEPLFEDFSQDKGADPQGQSVSQEYLSAVATRAIMFIEADNPKIGLMAFLGIGMTEVSTCEVTVKEGQHVKKGDEIGMFHFGGSTQCLMFRKGVEVRGFPQPGADHNVPVRGKLAEVF